MDLFGLVNVSSLSNKRYALVLVDDYSRYTWVRFLQSKDEAAQEIIALIKTLDKGSEDKVTILRSDNGTEFRNSTLGEFCKELGITQQFCDSPQIRGQD